MKSKKLDKILFPVLLVIYTGIMLYLFLMQCYQVPDFVSDMPDYVNHVAGIKGNYEFPYPLMFVLSRVLAVFLGAPAAVAVVTALLNGVAVIVTKHYMGCRLRDWPECAGMKWADLTVTFFTFALFLLGNLYSPKNTAFFGFDYAYRCMGIYTPNPIWNATYLATRPFAVICFFEACRILALLGARYQQGNPVAKISEAKAFPWKESLPFAVSLFLTTLTKPSYTMVVMPAMAVIMLIQLIRSRGRDFFDLFYLCVAMLPTVLVLLYQFGGVFSGTNVMGEETGIGFAFARVWSNYSSNIPLSIVMGMALPIGVLVLNIKELKSNGYYRFAWFNYLVATVMFLCLYEKGFRMLHANFSWGYMHGMFVVFLMTLLLMIKNTVRWRRSWKVVFVLAEWAVFLYHLACGINFLLYALQGKELAGF
ncbi:MAG: hypothetical protein J6C84_02575 [Lachnospiraceae bacterium]|nr:hypothetical protein [Lachnospiraceae bacterium]